MANYQTVEYRDEMLADKTVSRVYNNNRREWRTLTADGRVEWRDSAGANGVDELLGDGIVKRTVAGGNQPIYGREQGYGRTLWSNNLLTVNQTSFSGRIGTALAAFGGAALIGGLVAPPLFLSASEEEQLRQQQRAQQSSGSSDSGDSGSDSDWDDGGDTGTGDNDFG